MHEKAYHPRMKYSFNTPDTVLFVFSVLALFVLVQAMPFLGGEDAIPENVAEIKDSGESYIAPIVFNENNTVKDFSKEELQEIRTSYVLGREAYGPAWEEPAPVEVEAIKAPTKTASVPKLTAPKYSPIIPDGTPKIAIIIDDMGVSHGNSLRTIDLDAPLTLAFLPYADGLPNMTEKASDAGHELMIHMPMQAMTNPVSLGPIAIKAGMSAADVDSNMHAAFETFEGYEGVNNHMGSKATQDPVLMREVMKNLKQRNLFFVDSRTISTSVAAETAREYGLPVAIRDVFLDHEETPQFVAGALRKLEKVAVRKGHAIAIGHPKGVTIDALERWIPDAQKRGFQIVHVSELLERPEGQAKPPVVANVKWSDPKLDKVAEKVAKTEPAAAADTDINAGEVEVEIKTPSQGFLTTPVEDSNEAKAREEILKRLLGQ